MSIDFRITIKQLAPPWLLGERGSALLNTFGIMFNTMYQTLTDGLKARFPDYAPDDALRYLAKDRNLEQGPSEPSSNFKPRLRKGIDANRTRGTGHSILEQLAGYFNGIGNIPIRLVSQISGGTWHEYNYSTGVVTKTVSNNWNWDGNPTRYWYGFVIINSISGPWTGALKCGDPSGGTFGDGATCGSSATTQEVQTIQRLAQRWKPKKVYLVRIIVVFNNILYTRTNTKPPNPNGEMGDPVNFSSSACYWLGGGEQP